MVHYDETAPHLRYAFFLVVFIYRPNKTYKRLGIKVAINKESVTLNVINESLKLPFVKVDRSDFLTKTFSNKIDDMTKLFKEC